jgi:putative heme-binding domain-containing protein
MKQILPIALCLLFALRVASADENLQQTGPALEAELQQSSAQDLADAARDLGDAARGAVVFFQPQMACSKCHSTGEQAPSVLGPDLTTLGQDVTDAYLVESILSPSKSIRKEFATVSILTTEGAVYSALLIDQTDDSVTLRDVSRSGELRTLATDAIEEIKANETSMMPAGQVNQLNSRQQFYDLVKFLMEIRDGGAARARQLQPPASLLNLIVPEYENRLDHAAFIRRWDDASLQRGEAIYQRVCANCHGTKEQPGSLPTSLRFAEGKFKNGSDPLSMYRTLTHGFGLMAPQTWMVPSQKYDVIFYIRETYLKPHNINQYVTLDDAYLTGLPQGDTLGPEPSNIEPWSAMDYGPSLAHTFEVPGTRHNFAYKGIAVRLDAGAGGVSRGRHWMLFDTDTLRMAAGWSAEDTGLRSSVPKTGDRSSNQGNFIDWRGIQFNGEHGVHPRIVGHPAFTNSTGPGWANPENDQFDDNQRVLGRDGKRYGPLPKVWGKFKGLYHHDQRVIFSYSVGSTDVLETPRLFLPEESQQNPLLLRTLNIGPRDRDLYLQVTEHPETQSQLSFVDPADQSTVVIASPHADSLASDNPSITFDGKTYLEVPQGGDFDTFSQDFSVVAKIKSNADGTIWSHSEGGPKWSANGQSFFIRDGRLCFDIGWVGAVSARTKVTDNQWHSVAVTWQRSNAKVRLYVDGILDGEGTLAATQALPKSVMRIGFTSPNFPQPATFFRGEIAQLLFYQQRLEAHHTDVLNSAPPTSSLSAEWRIQGPTGSQVPDRTPHQHHADVRSVAEESPSKGRLIAGFAPRNTALRWSFAAGRLQVRIPAGQEPLRFTVWLTSDQRSDVEVRDGRANEVAKWSGMLIPQADLDLTPMTRGGPPRWPQVLTTQAVVGADNGPFAADTLTAPEANPWLAQTRFSGLDFFADGRIAVCTWDGDVWIVTPGSQPADRSLQWQRIASGLFQPLGLKVIKEKIHVICRDQLAVLHDLNGDGEIDYYQCLNNDHQVTEHFHEFAMGLQTDAAGHFYYAKSGCHGKAAVVPHHGTLLRISPDGSSTTILANGFRAANGVCLNPDGSFVVTDQEGFWNPKNRINWVTHTENSTPNFYGNMLGYHDVTDTADSAMVSPLCWITNAFDRSPAELLWVDSERWGSLHGSLLNLSYGYGKVFLVPHESANGKMQGGMIELPIPAFPTGVMRGRFHPLDGQLYLCGMFAWAGNATHPGGLYRLRSTGKPVALPINLQAAKSGLRLTFTEAIDPDSLDEKRISVKTWSLQRTANYGSEHFDEKFLEVTETALSADGKILMLRIPDIQPTWCMEIQYDLQTAAGDSVRGTIHNTIHELVD